MAINLPSGFSILNVDPIDSRFVVADQNARLGFSSANVYEGLLVYQQDNDTLYVLTDTTNYNQTSGWTEVGSGADLSALNNFTGSIQSEVDSLTAATSSYLTELPSGVVSGSDQITSIITDSYISASAALSGFGEGAHTDISSLNDFTSSIQSEVDSLTAATSSYLTDLPSGVISSSLQISITEAQITDLAHTDISALNTFSGSAQAQIDALISATSSYLTSETDSQTLSIVGNELSISNGNTVTIPTGSTIDTSSFVTNDQTGSFLTDLPSGVVSSSAQITITEAQITDLTHTDITALNNFSGSIQSEVDSLTAATSSYLTELPSGVVSSSAQITITEAQISDLTHTDISSLNTFTGSIQSEVDSLTAATSSYLTDLPSGIISSSAQITITEDQIADLTHTDITALNTFSGSIQSEVDSLTAATSSYLTELPSGVVSSSLQSVENLVGQDVVVKTLTAETYIVSSSLTYMTTSFSSGSTMFGDTSDDTHQFTGSLLVFGNVEAPSFTGSLFGTSSWAENAVNSVSSSFLAFDATYGEALTISSSAPNQIELSRPSGTTQTISFDVNIATSASYASTASFISPEFISASVAAAGFGSSVGGGIFAQTGSVYSTTNDLEVTGSMTINNGVLRLTELTTTPDPVDGAIFYSASNFYFGMP